MNARAWSGLFVTLAVLLASTSFAFGQTIRITTPTDNFHVEIDYDGDVAEETADVGLEFAVTTGSAADQVEVVIDEGGSEFIPASTGPVPYMAVGLSIGSHYATAFLVNGSGARYATAVSVVHFYVSRVCGQDDQCVDDDPCSNQQCVGRSGLGSWYGRCRYGLATTDADCCVTSEWCRHRGFTLDAFETQYQCVDVDTDGVKDCVQCTQEDHCQAVIDAENENEGISCKTNPVCNASNGCEFDQIDGCCVTNLHCNDGNPCTTDSCDADTGTCTNTVIEGCCVPGNDAQPLGAPNFGCTPPGADDCKYYTCIGQGAIAVCRSGPKYAGCCAANTDCTDPLQLNTCTDNDGLGYGSCGAIGGDPAFPTTGTCTYPKIHPECCVKNYQCASRYPEFIGTCVDQPGEDWDICTYAENPDFCESPVTAIVVNEVMVDPAGPPTAIIPDYYGEWFEVFNPTNTDINMDGWTIEDLGEGPARQSFTIDNRGFFNVPAGGFRIFVRNNEPLSNGFLPRAGYAWPADDFSLENDEDQIVIKNPAGEVQDQISFDSTWAYRPGASMALINPYLDNANALSWATSKVEYGNSGNLGSPTLHNSDVFDENVTAGLTCDDGNPCTVDICNLDKADICAHRKLKDCCTAATAATSCNDLNACTTDSCNVATNECVHTTEGACCVSDVDCETWYPDSITSVTEQEAFDLCAYKVCIGNTCRYGRNLYRPGCCVASDSADFGCFDRNVCTQDVCVPLGGQDTEGIAFNQCAYDLDLNGDSINDCCRLPEDCDDGDPSTHNYCDMLDDSNGPGINFCHYPDDDQYCGPGSANPTCDDGDICTTDFCCDGIDSPHGDCPAEYRCVHIRQPDCCASAQNCVDGLACTTDTCVNGVCVHEEVAAGCCETHADCNGAGKPADMYCRTGYCIGKVCRFGPAIAGCCVDAADCSPTTCTDYQCINHSCQAEQVANCCLTGADCPEDPNPCKSNVCIQNQCTSIDLPGCCTDDDPSGPDTSCDDGNPCTADYCMEQGGAMQCRYFPVGGAGCCNTVDMCPDDNVQCTELACSDASCELNPLTTCLATSPYRMTFTEGHSVYAGEYQSVLDLAWRAVDEGTNAASHFFTFANSTGVNAPTLGPDTFLTFRPNETVAAFNSCVELPKFRTTDFSNVTVGFDWGADWASGNVAVTLLGRVGGGWSAATELWSATVSADTAPAHVNAQIPVALLNSELTQVALCVAGTTTDAVIDVMFDEVVLSQGQAPTLDDITSKSVGVGLTKTFADAFAVTEMDVDENITLTIENSPGSWVKIENVRKSTGTATGWLGDLVVTGAVCPSSEPYNYSLKVKASDGALLQEKSFVLVVTGCE